jgi:microcystin-dependent protein
MATKSALGYNGYTLPVGSVISFFGKNVPSGFLVCDGTTYQQADYPQLFSVLNGIGYGQTATEFDLPNLVDYFIQGSNTNANTTNAGSAGTLAVDFSLTEENIPPFATNSQNALTFNCATDGHSIITTNDYTIDVGGSPTQTFLSGGHNNSHPAGSVTVNLSNQSASYAGTGSVQSITASDVPVPACYLLRFCIRADYPNL